MNLRDKLLREETTSGGYPNDGIGGPASDDDGAPGTTVFGDKMVKVEVPNRLTGKTIKYIPADETDEEWNYDEFDASKSMGSYKSYSNTLNGLDKLLQDRLWKHTDARKFRMSQDKWLARKGSKDGGVEQKAKTGDDDPSHMELTKGGELSNVAGEKPTTNDYWREVPNKQELKVDITEKIKIFLGTEDEIVTEEIETVNEEVLATNDRKTITKILWGGKSAKIKIKSLGIDVLFDYNDESFDVIYPKNDDFTMSLVDISDSLGFPFSTSKHGKNEVFTIYID